MSNINIDDDFKTAFYKISLEHARTHKANLIQNECFKKIIDGDNQDIPELLPQTFVRLGRFLRSLANAFQNTNVPDNTVSSNDDLAREFTSDLKNEIQILSDRQFSKKNTLTNYLESVKQSTEKLMFESPLFKRLAEDPDCKWNKNDLNKLFEV